MTQTRSESPKKRFRASVTILFFGFWLLLFGILIKDQFSATTADDPGDGLKFSSVESDDWFLLRIGGAYAGFGRSRQFRKENYWLIRDDLNISLNIQGQIKPIKIVNESHVDDAFRLISFHTKVSSGLISFEQRGQIEGRDLVFQIPSFQGGGTKRLKLHEVPRISRSLGLPVPLTGLKVGDDIKLPLFDPMDGNKWDAQVQVLEKTDLEILGQKIEAWRVRAIFRSIDVVMWIDSEGRLLKGRMPLNITVTRSDQAEIAREMRLTRDLPEMIGLTAVPVEGMIPESPDLKLLRMKIIGGNPSSFPSDGFRQTTNNEEITIRSEQIPQPTFELPYTGKDMADFLAPSRFIRSDNAEIIKMARTIIGNEKDPLKAARLINDWVFKNIKKVPTPAVPDAYSVLHSRQGDCNEHAVLAVSLARAVGLPSKMAVGLVHGDDGFLYHAWVAYWAGNQWFTGDPLTGKMHLPSTYITLMYGDVDKHLNVLEFLGKLRFKVLEVS